MRIFLFVALVLTIGRNCSATPTLVVKYSDRDCINCSLSLITVKSALPENRKIIFFKSNFRNHPESEEIVEVVNHMGFQVHFSDSAFYSLSPTERSEFWIMNDGKIEYTDLLSKFEFEKAKKYGIKPNQHVNISQNHSENNQNDQPTNRVLLSSPFVGVDFFKANGSIGYQNGRTEDLLVYHPGKGSFDTIRLRKIGISDKVYEANIGSKFRDSIRSIESFFSVRGIPRPTQYNTPYFKGDSIFIVAYVRTYYSMGVDNTGERAFSIPQVGALLTIVRDRIVSAIPIPPKTYKGAEAKPLYELLATNIFEANGEFLIPVWKTNREDIGAVNYLMSRFDRKDINFLGFTKFHLPEMQERNRLGYNLLTFCSDRNLVMVDNDNVVHDIKTDKSYSIPVFTEPNNVEEEVFTTLSPKFVHLVLDIKSTKDGMELLYTQHDSLFHTTFIKKDNKLSVSKTTLLAASYPNAQYAHPTLFTSGGIISYNTTKSEFIEHK